MWLSTGVSYTNVYDVGFSLVYTRRGWRVAAPLAYIVKGYQTNRRVYYFVSDRVPHIRVRMTGSRNERTGPTPHDFLQNPFKYAKVSYQGRFPVPNYEEAKELVKHAVIEMAQWLENNTRGCPAPPCKSKWVYPILTDCLEDLKDFPITVANPRWWKGKIVLAGGAVIYPHEAILIAMERCEFVNDLPPFVDTHGKVVDPKRGWLIETGPESCTLITPTVKGFQVHRSTRSMPVPIEERKPVFVGEPSPSEILRTCDEEDYEIYEDVYVDEDEDEEHVKRSNITKNKRRM